MATTINDQTQEPTPDVNALVPIAQPDGGGGYLGRSATVQSIVDTATPYTPPYEEIVFRMRFSLTSNPLIDKIYSNPSGLVALSARQGVGQYTITFTGGWSWTGTLPGNVIATLQNGDQSGSINFYVTEIFDTGIRYETRDNSGTLTDFLVLTSESAARGKVQLYLP